jgi:hypothetical protein
MKINHPSISTDRAIGWYDHYLQHPSHSRLKETMISVIYWKDIHNNDQSGIYKDLKCVIVVVGGGSGGGGGSGITMELPCVVSK